MAFYPVTMNTEPPRVLPSSSHDNTVEVLTKALFGAVPFFGFLAPLFYSNSSNFCYNIQDGLSISKVEGVYASISLSFIAGVVTEIALAVIFSDLEFLLLQGVLALGINALIGLGWMYLENQVNRATKEDPSQVNVLERGSAVKFAHFISRVALYSIPIMNFFAYHEEKALCESTLNNETPSSPQFKAQLLKQHIINTDVAALGSVVQLIAAVALSVIGTNIASLFAILYGGAMTVTAIRFLWINSENKKSLDAYTVHGESPSRVVGFFD